MRAFTKSNPQSQWGMVSFQPTSDYTDLDIIPFRDDIQTLPSADERLLFIKAVSTPPIFGCKAPFWRVFQLAAVQALDTVVQGAAPVSTGVRCVQHFRFLGLLPLPSDGWSDITEHYVARYGVPPAGTVIFIRTCQHIDGSTDVPKMTSARLPAPTV
jgi:hypothetical protein